MTRLFFRRFAALTIVTMMLTTIPAAFLMPAYAGTENNRT